MKLSNNTKRILENFSLINDNILIKPGSTLKTISSSRTVLGSATIEETFPQEFGIYNLKNFLAIYKILDDADLEFDDRLVIMKSGNQRVRYTRAETATLETPPKDIALPSVDVELVITHPDRQTIDTAARTLGCSFCHIHSKGKGKTRFSTLNDKDKSSNEFSIELDHESKVAFDMHFDLNNLSLVAGDYLVQISSKLISKWANTADDTKVEYFIAVDKASTFNG